jgi:tRNA 2-thiouridine synthesizing protein C
MGVLPLNISFFLFCGEVSAERLQWIRECISVTDGSQPAESARGLGGSEGCKLFLTGDALMSLIDARIEQEWIALSSDPRVEVIVDGDELRLHGLRDEVNSRFSGVNITGNSSSAKETTFWQSLVIEIQEKWNEIDKAAFLLCYSPYMSRTPVYMLRFLKSVVEAGLTPEIYTYLDGVHAAHKDQKPYEFENIGEGIVAISTVAGSSGEDPWFGACSRCATARGYYVKNPKTGGCEPVSFIDAVTIRSLKEILDRFRGDHPILAHTCGCAPASRVTELPGADNLPPILTVMITNTPYVSEWTFGGLSMAVAAAMGGIETRVIFIEQGVYSLCGNHEVTPQDRVFNVQEMVEATSDIPDLHYFVYTPSIRVRGLKVAECQSFVETVDGPGLGALLGVKTHAKNGRLIRTIFF